MTTSGDAMLERLSALSPKRLALLALELQEKLDRAAQDRAAEGRLEPSQGPLMDPQFAARRIMPVRR